MRRHRFCASAATAYRDSGGGGTVAEPDRACRRRPVAFAKFEGGENDPPADRAKAQRIREGDFDTGRRLTPRARLAAAAAIHSVGGTTQSKRARVPAEGERARSQRASQAPTVGKIKFRGPREYPRI